VRVILEMGSLAGLMFFPVAVVVVVVVVGGLGVGIVRL
jgi:hypothetical protein